MLVVGATIVLVYLWAPVGDICANQDANVTYRSCNSACIVASSALHSVSPHLSFSLHPLWNSQLFLLTHVTLNSSSMGLVVSYTLLLWIPWASYDS